MICADKIGLNYQLKGARSNPQKVVGIGFFARMV